MSLQMVIEPWQVSVPVFVLIFCISLYSLKSVGLFGPSGNFIVSACVSALCVLSMFNFTSPGDTAKHAVSKDTSKVSTVETDSQRPVPREPQDHKDHRIILLPYFALLVTVVTGLLLWLLAMLLKVCDKIVNSSQLMKNKKKSGSTKQICKQSNLLKFITKYKTRKED